MKQLVLFACMTSTLQAMNEKSPRLYTRQDLKKSHEQKIARDEKFKAKQENRTLRENKLKIRKEKKAITDS